jgi:GNAT superfamily N-acetyltransferase
MTVKLRPPTRDDAPELAALCGQLGYPCTPAETTRRLEHLLHSAGHFLRIAVDEDDRALGWIHACEVHHLESGPLAEVGGMVVAEPCRKKGIGAALLAAAERWAMSAGIALLRVRSDIVRGDAHRFYLRSGYRRTKTSHLFEKALG